MILSETKLSSRGQLLPSFWEQTQKPPRIKKWAFVKLATFSSELLYKSLHQQANLSIGENLQEKREIKTYNVACLKLKQWQLKNFGLEYVLQTLFPDKTKSSISNQNFIQQRMLFVY